MRTRKLITGACLFFLIVFCEEAAVAFDPNEHRQVSNEAISICLALLNSNPQFFGWEPGHEDVRLKEAREVLAFLAVEDTPKKHPTYGELVASVDHYYIAPLKYDGADRFIRNKKEQLHPRSRALRLSFLTSGLRRLLAVHHNELHFQGAAIDGIQHFHTAAIQAAAESHHKEDLEAALVLNSLADHLIEDFLAPGHVATPRDDFHDLPSALVHDISNAQGLMFKVHRDSSGWAAIRSLSEAIKAATSQDPGAEYSSVVAFVRGIDESHSDIPHLLFKGDGQLMCSKDQRYYILLQVVRSIADVISSYIAQEPIDELQTSQWLWIPPSTAERNSIDSLTEPLTNPLGETSSGEYELTDPHVRFTKLPGLFVAYSQVPANDQSAIRLAFRAEATASGAAVKWLTEGAGQSGWLIGWTGVSLIKGPHLKAFDVHRFAVVSTRPWRSNLQLTLRGGIGLYDNDAAEHVKFRVNGGIGLEKAFSLIAVRVELEKVFFSDGPELRSHWAPSVGFNLMLPLTWATHLKPHKACK